MKAESWDHINQALAIYDTLGVHYATRLLPKRLVLKFWHHPLKAVYRPASMFVKHRSQLGIKQHWNGSKSAPQESHVSEVFV
jgi:hypothetical protein